MTRPRLTSPVRRGRLAALPPAICLALTPLLVAAPAALAQPEEGQRSVEPGQSPFRAAPTININFRGGSIGDYLKAVKEAAAPTPVNVIVSDDVARLKANPVELREVTIETALDLLSVQGGQTLTPEPLILRASGGKDGSAPVFALVSPEQQGFSRPRREAPAPQRSVQVFSIRDLVEPDPGSPGALTIDPETLMSSIDAAMSLHGESEGRDVLFHPEAGILIVRAADEEIAVISSLLNEIRSDLMSRRDSARHAAEQTDQLKRRLSELERRQEVAAAEFQHAERRVEEAERLQEQGAISATELEELRLMAVRTRLNFESLQHEYGEVRQQLREREAQAPAGDDRQSLLNEITRLKAEIAALRAELGRGEGDRGRGDR